MTQGHFEEHWMDDRDGEPAGGVSYGTGFTISWQNGPLGRCAEDCAAPQHSEACTRRKPNGAFVEDVIAAVVGRLEFYQRTRFECHDNAIALVHLGHALRALFERTRNREARGVEGTHEK